MGDAGCLYGVNVLKIKNLIQFRVELVEAARRKSRAKERVESLEAELEEKLAETLDNNQREGGFLY